MVSGDTYKMRLGGDHNLEFAGADASFPGNLEGHDSQLIGVSSLFKQVLSIADSVAGNDCVVLIEGESGTGKELVARRIHSHSSRSQGPFVPVNCPSISESLFESQFFGHEKGAFTGAASSTLGMVRAAEDGSLLLDEVGEMPLHLQPKLLRLLQEREVTPVGASRPIPVNARFMAATNRSLAKQVSEGKFRSDLYHRLNVVRIEIPPLRSRPDDILPLLDYYLDFYAHQYGMARRVIGRGLREAIMHYPWPGNVRELCCYVERMYAANLPPMPPTSSQWDDGYVSQRGEDSEAVSDRLPSMDDQTRRICTLREAEARAIRRALQATSFNRSAAARLLNIHRSTLLRKIRDHRLDSDDNRPQAEV